jgi:hypothetical protein
MKKDSIIQFVGFITNLEFEEFVAKWEFYAKRFHTASSGIILQESVSKSRFKYLSQHVWAGKDFRFAFMKERNSEHFPEHNVKVLQAGGYTALQAERRRNEDNGDIKIMAFTNHNENDINFYKQLPGYNHLNIYQAYYESCSYGYILEFFMPETDSLVLVQQLKTRAGTEVAIYRECMVPHV